MNGKGAKSLKNGERYEGYFKKDLLHREGFARNEGGRSSIGDWVEGKLNGKGKWTDGKGFFCEGVMQDGNLKVRGSLFILLVIRSTFQKNIRHGKGVYSFACGDKNVGDWPEVRELGMERYFVHLEIDMKVSGDE